LVIRSIMFWKFHLDSSGIETLLAKEDVTLKEVLDDEDILQECKTQNGKLIDFLIKDDILKELLHMVVDEPPDETEEMVRFKYANTACEVLTSDIYSVLDKIATDTEFVSILWSFVDTTPPVNSLMASFFSKVITMLMLRKGQEMFDFMKAHDAVNKLLLHIEMSAIMELFIKMVTVVESQDMRLEISRWLSEEDLVKKLIELMHPSQPDDKHYYASQLLSELTRIGRDCISQYTESEDDPLLITLEKKDTANLLLDTMLNDLEKQANSDSSIVNGVSTLLSMIEMKRPTVEGVEELITPMDVERIVQGVHNTLEALAPRLNTFHDILLCPPSQQPMETTVGILDPPLGQVRLSIACLITSAVATNTQFLNDELAKTGTMNVLLDLFIRYEWNNFLHTYVQQAVSAILNSEPIPNDNGEESENKLLKHLFQECNLIQKVLRAWEFNETSEKQESSAHRKGYMGHLTKMTNDIISAKDSGPNNELIKSLFNELSDETRQQWVDLINGPLDEINAKNTCLAVSLMASQFDSGSESEDGSTPINISQYEGTLQQAFENYQVQPMTNDFIDSFGYDEDNLHESEMIKNPFDEVGNIDFTIRANDETENEKLFESVCKEKIRPFDESSSDEEDTWEEKQLEFAPNPNASSEARGRGSSGIASDSDSDSPASSDEDDAAAKGSNRKVKAVAVAANNDPFGSKTEDKVEKMDIDAGWTANFGDDGSGMDTSDQTNDAWMQTVAKAGSLPAEGANAVVADFADFTDISKFESSSDHPPQDSPMALDQDPNSPKPGAAYEVQMEDCESNQASEKSPQGQDHVVKEGGKPKTNLRLDLGKKTTQQTAKSPDKQAQNSSAAGTTSATNAADPSGYVVIDAPKQEKKEDAIEGPIKEENLPKVSMARRVTSITVKSVRSPSKNDNIEFPPKTSKEECDSPSSPDTPNVEPKLNLTNDVANAKHSPTPKSTEITSQSSNNSSPEYVSEEPMESTA